MITLVIIDVQNDFVTGTTQIKGAKTILENIRKFIKQNCQQIDKILFTCEWHPYNHCSFKQCGGLLPKHCVQFTPGACIEPKLLKYVQSLNIPYEVSTRGEMVEVEQCGAFEDVDFVQDALGSRYYLDSIVTADANTDFVVCGISGDHSVKETIINLMDNKIIPKVYMPGIISSDGGKLFSDFIKDNNIEKVV